MEKYIVILDLDGTLLDNQASIPEYNKQVIQALQQHGHHVVIATGRSYYRSHWFYQELGLNTLLFNRNSSHIHHPMNDSFNPLLTGIEKVAIQKLMDESIRQCYEKIYFESGNQLYVLKGDKEYYLNELFKPLVIHVWDFLDFESIENVNIIQLFVSPNDLNEYESYLKTIVHIEYSVHPIGELVLIQIYPKKGDKKFAIPYLCDYYQIPKERVIAMGDGVNDVEMLKEAGIGVAMANASDIVKKHADRVTQFTNDECGVGHFLTEFFHLAI